MSQTGTPKNRIRELRKRAGMQQKELALLIGVAYPTVSEWENHKKDPSGDRLKQLCDIFNVPSSVVLGFEEIPNPVPVLFVDNGDENANPHIQEARRLVQQDPERGVLFSMATNSDIKYVRRAIAVLDALNKLED